MFVRILRNKGTHDSVFECERSRIKPVEGLSDKIDVELLGKNGPVLTTEYECKDLEIILMNNDGKTIDRRVW
jgi:hypothetical protein